MPLSFAVLGVGREPDDIMVSRMAPPRRSPMVRMPMKRRMVTSANQMLFGPTPIEQTLRQRQALVMQTSMSDPSLGLTQAQAHAQSKPMLPRIGSHLASGRADKSFGRSGAAWVDPHFGTGHNSYESWSAVSADGSLGGHVGGASLVVSPLPGLKSNVDNWCGLLGGDYRIEVPFNTFQEDDDRIDPDAFMRWYNHREAERGAQASRFRCPRPNRELLPWASERDVGLVQLKGAEAGSGRAFRLLGKVDLYDHLESVAPLRGLEALLEALTFRLDSLDNAQRLLDCNGSQRLSFMEFAGSMGLLGLDLQALTGMEEHLVFLGLDRDHDGVIPLSDLIRLSDALKPKKQKSRPGTQERPRSRPGTQDGNTSVIFEDPVCMAELRLQAPKEDPPEVLRAMAKWSHVARWMAAAAQRSVALRTERLLHGWKVPDKVAAPAPAEGELEESAEDTFVTDIDEKSHAAAEGAGGSPSCSPKRPNSRARPRRRPSTLDPRQLTLEGLAAMREQEFSLRALFNAAASQKLADGTPEMTRADLHLFFQDLQLADWGRHKRASAGLLDKLYDEAIALQCMATRIGNGLTFWSMKVVLSNIVAPLGLGWRRLIEMAITPEALSDALRTVEAPSRTPSK